MPKKETIKKKKEGKEKIFKQRNMKNDLELRIAELKELISAKWTTFQERDEAEGKLERLEQFYEDLYGY